MVSAALALKKVVTNGEAHTHKTADVLSAGSNIEDFFKKTSEGVTKNMSQEER